MALAQPLTTSLGAWQAIRDEVVGPAASEGVDAFAIALDAAWREARREGDRVTVWLSPELAAMLARMLDARPEIDL